MIVIDGQGQLTAAQVVDLPFHASAQSTPPILRNKQVIVLLHRELELAE